MLGVLYPVQRDVLLSVENDEYFHVLLTVKFLVHYIPALILLFRLSIVHVLPRYMKQISAFIKPQKKTGPVLQEIELSLKSFSIYYSCWIKFLLLRSNTSYVQYNSDTVLIKLILK